MKLDILYRGYLSSCNYACHYCPFAKQHDDRRAREKDAVALQRFVQWVSSRRRDQLGVFFTPWGEALIRRSYRDAIVALSKLPQLRKVAIQTNLSGSLAWLDQADSGKIAIWATYHPQQTSQDAFLGQCATLDKLGINYSVGIVGLKQHAAVIGEMRQKLNQDIYLWINSPPDAPAYYDEKDIEYFSQIDPLFHFNWQPHQSHGKSCFTGESVISVSADGTITRCHFDKAGLGNLYSDDIEKLLAPRVCAQSSCDCHIGYVHLKSLNLYDVFGNGVLERIPKSYAVKSAIC